MIDNDSDTEQWLTVKHHVHCTMYITLESVCMFLFGTACHEFALSSMEDNVQYFCCSVMVLITTLISIFVACFHRAVLVENSQTLSESSLFSWPKPPTCTFLHKVDSIRVFIVSSVLTNVFFIFMHFSYSTHSFVSLTFN